MISTDIDSMRYVIMITYGYKKPITKPNLDLSSLKHDVRIDKRYAFIVNNHIEQLSSIENTADEDWNQI